MFPARVLSGLEVNICLGRANVQFIMNIQREKRSPRGRLALSDFVFFVLRGKNRHFLCLRLRRA